MSTRRSILPLGIVALLLSLGSPIVVRAATMGFSPSIGTYSVGQTFSVTIRVNAAGKAMNAAEATATFPTDLLTLKSVSKSSSVLQYWATNPSGSNASGRVVFSGGLPSPGYSGSAGTLIVMTFQAKAVGTAKLAMTSGSVLANDGLGTDILTGSGSASFTIKSVAPSNTNTQQPEQPVEQPQPTAKPTPALTVSVPAFSDPTRWYTPQSAVVSWTQTAGLLGVSYILSQNADAVPDATMLTTESKATVVIPTDGVWYFAIRGKYDSGWSAVTRYKLQRDSTAPEPFTVGVVQDRGATDPTPVLSFTASDALSGVARYTLTLDGADPQEVTNPAALQITTSGHHSAIITAYDAAGNVRESSVEFDVVGYPAPIITYVSTPIILLSPIVIEGTASLNDDVTVYINDEVLGTAKATHALSSDSMRVSWSVTTSRVYRPGTYRITAKVKNGEQESVLSDPTQLKVSGASVQIGGRTVATVALIPVAVTAIGALLVLLILLFLHLWVTLFRVERKEVAAWQALDRLRLRLLRGRISGAEVEEQVVAIEKTLGKAKTRRRGTRAKK